MREEREKVIGDTTIAEPYSLWGSIIGNVTVVKGAKFYVRGSIYGHLTVKAGGRAHVFGNVSGDLTVLQRGKVIHSGIVGGDAVNRGGRLYIESTARVLGRVRTEDGETTIEPKSA